MNKQEKIIMFDSSEAATYRTNIEGWVSSSGRFFGKDERAARYEGSTHHTCECGNIAKRGYIYCDACNEIKDKERYEKMPFIEWDGETPLVLYRDDKYFWHPEEIEEYCENEDVNIDDLQLVVCEPNHLDTISFEDWSEILPDDREFRDEYPELANKIDEINKYIESLPSASWSAGKFRTNYTPL